MRKLATLVSALVTSLVAAVLLASPATASNAQDPAAAGQSRPSALEAAPATPTNAGAIEGELQAADISLRGLCNYNGSHPTIRRGDTGAAVSHAQCLLKNYQGYGYLAIDGVFGPQTEDAVRDFQRRRGITVDGIVGPVTWDRLHP